MLKGSTFDNLSKKFQDQQKERIVEVRKQEAELAKNLVIVNKTQKQLQKEAYDKQKKLEEYQAKLKAIEELQKLKEQTIMTIGEAQRQAIKRKLELDQEEARKQEIIQQNKQLQNIRNKKATEWLQQEWVNSKDGQNFERINHLKYTINKEKQKEIEDLEKFKMTQIDVQENKNYKELIKQKKSVLKPEDFINTHFHNPSVIKNQMDEDIENAMDRANTVLIKSQAQLEQTAKQWREQEKQVRERGRNALKKIQDENFMEQFNKDYLKKKRQEAREIVASKSPHNDKPQSTSSKRVQILLKEEIPVIKDQKVKSISKKKIQTPNKEQTKSKSQRPKKESTLKKKGKDTKPVYTSLKKPDNQTSRESVQSSNRVDYTDYPLNSQSKQETQRKVKFQEISEVESNYREASVREYNQSKEKLNNLIQQEELQQIYSDQIQNEFEEGQQQEYDSQEQSLDQEQDLSNTQKTKFQEQSISQRSQIVDMNTYIREQEEYLSRLEEERRRITEQMRKEEQSLLSNFKNQSEVLKQNEIIQEEDSQSQSSINGEQQYPPETPQKENIQDDIHQKLNPKQQYDLSSSSLYSYSPESNLQSSQKKGQQDDVNAKSIMMKFLRPQH